MHDLHLTEIHSMLLSLITSNMMGIYMFMKLCFVARLQYAALLQIITL